MKRNISTISILSFVFLFAFFVGTAKLAHAGTFNVGDVLINTGLSNGTTYSPGDSVEVFAEMINTSSSQQYNVSLAVSNNNGAPVDIIPITALSAGDDTNIVSYIFMNGAPNTPDTYNIVFIAGVGEEPQPVLALKGGEVRTSPEAVGGAVDTNVMCSALLTLPAPSGGVDAVFKFKTQQNSNTNWELWDTCNVFIPPGDTYADNFPGNPYFQGVQIENQCFDASATGIPNNSGIATCN